LWQTDPRISDLDLIDAFHKYGCAIKIFENADFGSNYPHSNKFYAMLSLPGSEPFVFLDSDVILTGPLHPERLDFARPALRPAESTWPRHDRRGRGSGDPRTIGEVWRSLYEFFDLDPSPYFDSDRGENRHQCFPYYNAGFIYYTGPEPLAGAMLEMAKRLWTERPPALGSQPLTPWLDQIVLPLALARLGVPRSANTIHPVAKSAYHYHLPCFLLIRRPAIRIFAELSKDKDLLSVLNHDNGFRYYLSDEGKALVEKTYADFLASGEKEHKAFTTLLRSRAPILR
jgi:hypothetical protein